MLAERIGVNRRRGKLTDDWLVVLTSSADRDKGLCSSIHRILDRYHTSGLWEASMITFASRIQTDCMSPVCVIVRDPTPMFVQL